MIGGCVGFGVGWVKAKWTSMRDMKLFADANKTISKDLGRYFEKLINWELTGRSGEMPEPPPTLQRMARSEWEGDILNEYVKGRSNDGKN
jgi:hypothetical protein